MTFNKILVVEDNQLDLMALKRHFKKVAFKYQIEAATSVTETKHALSRSQQYDLLLVDYNLGDGTGFDIMDMQTNIPIIVMTSHGDEALAVGAMKRGAADYIVKDHDRVYLDLLPLIINRAITHQQHLRHSKKIQYEQNLAAIAQFDLNGNFANGNETLAHILGYPSAEIMTQLTWAEIITKPFDETLKQLQTALEGIHPGINLEFRKRDTSIGYAIANLALIHPEGYARPYVYLSFIDITQQKETELALAISEKRYRAMVDQQPDAVCRYDTHLRLTYVNQAYVDYFGQSAETLIGRHLKSLIAPRDYQLALDRYNQLTPQNPVNISEHRSLMPNGELRWFQWIDHALLDENGNIYEYQGVGRDITERKLVEDRLAEVNRTLELRVTERTKELEITQQELAEALKQERELNELKSRFISMTSHEFRTPLSSIDATCQTLREFYDRMSPDDRIKRFNRIGAQIEHMTNMLDDILLIGQLQEGKLTLNLEKFVLSEYFQSIVDEFEQMNSTHTLHCACEAHDEEIIADKKLLRQMCTNLISNAIKYSAATSNIYLSLTTDQDWVIFEVRDEGIGIPAADQAKLFEAFHRADNVGGIQGTGLGLSIAKRAVDLHHGKITFYSQEEKGTTFKIRLPMTPPVVAT